MRLFFAAAAAPALLAFAAPTGARPPGDPIRLAWGEGDVAGMTTIYGPQVKEPIGFVLYRQIRHGDRLSTERVARFRDGSSDEDTAEARVGDTLEAIGGRSLIRDRDGEPIVDVRIDVEHGHIQASWGRGADRNNVDEHVDLSRGTYWGPLVFIVLKNFDANAQDGRLTFRTIAPTPKPMVLDMELSRGSATALERVGLALEAEPFSLSPTVHWLIDPLVRAIAPRATFWMLPGDPPALARFAGPRNYLRQQVVIQ